MKKAPIAVAAALACAMAIPAAGLAFASAAPTEAGKTGQMAVQAAENGSAAAKENSAAQDSAQPAATDAAVTTPQRQYVDADGNGICDNFGTRQDGGNGPAEGYGPGSSNCDGSGKGARIGAGNGVCDGTGNGAGNGYGPANGYGPGSANCDGTGQGGNHGAHAGGQAGGRGNCRNA